MVADLPKHICKFLLIFKSLYQLHYVAMQTLYSRILCSGFNHLYPSTFKLYCHKKGSHVELTCSQGFVMSYPNLSCYHILSLEINNMLGSDTVVVQHPVIILSCYKQWYSICCSNVGNFLHIDCGNKNIKSVM